MPSRSYAPLDDPPLPPEGDNGFIGFRSRLYASELPPGVAHFLGNMRCERGTARVRGGVKALNTDLLLTNNPIILDFTLGADLAVSSLTSAAGTATLTTTASHGFTSGRIVNVRGAAQTAYNGDFSIIVTGLSTFTYPVSGGPASPATGTILVNGGPVVYNTYGDSVRCACEVITTSDEDGIVIVSNDRAFLYRYGLPIAQIDYPGGEVVADSHPSAVVQALGKVYIFRGTGKTALEWDRNPASDFVVVPTGAHGSGGTFIKMPNVDWGVQFGRRLALPKSTDEVVLSDLGDADTYDTIYAQFRFIQGQADRLVAAHVTQQTKLLLFCDRSIHLMFLDGEDLDLAGVQEITRDIGCVARRSIATCGDEVLWLSSQGVHRMPISSELNLRTAQEPLSAPIQDVISTINWTYVAGAVARYIDNRYYLAVPTGSATSNNALLVYNFLNREWESVDTFPDDFDIRELLKVRYAGEYRVHAITTFGYTYLLDELAVDQWWNGSSVVDAPISGSIETREYYGAQPGVKQFMKAEIDADCTVADAFSISLITRNPDSTSVVADLVIDETNDKLIRPRLRARGRSARLSITTTAGRPEFRGAVLNASATDRTYYTRK